MLATCIHIVYTWKFIKLFHHPTKALYTNSKLGSRKLFSLMILYANSKENHLKQK
jgi:hypothetical protein